jgi:hypothetical protein
LKKIEKMPTEAVSGPGPVETTKKESPARIVAAASALRSLVSKVQRLPRWANISGLAAAILLAMIGVYVYLGSGTAKLRIVCSHSFRTAELSVVVDGDVVYEGNISGGRKRFGLFQKSSSGAFSKAVRVPPGKHAVQVHMAAAAEGYDQVKVSYAAFTDEQENVLSINAGRHTALNVNFQGGAIAQAPTLQTESRSSSYPKSAFSILLSVLGTMLSATISFLVQEFWRNHKQRVASQVK